MQPGIEQKQKYPFKSLSEQSSFGNISHLQSTGQTKKATSEWQSPTTIHPFITTHCNSIALNKTQLFVKSPDSVAFAGFP